MSFFKKIIPVIIIAIMVSQCSKRNEFVIKKGAVGNLDKETVMLDLLEIFENDSLVSGVERNDLEQNSTSFVSTSGEYIVFSKTGKKMLEIVPANLNDSLSKIKSIQIFDPSYKTEKGVSLASNFSDINKNYMVNKVETTLTSATLFIDELNATISIDKKELGLNQFSREQIRIDQIPDLAKIKYFTIWFN